MADRIHHIAIQVDNIARAVEWYQREFEIDVSFQDETWAMLQFENMALALVLPEQHPSHFAIEKNDAGLYGPLKRHRDGTASVYIADPFNNAIEFIQVSIPEDSD